MRRGVPVLWLMGLAAVMVEPAPDAIALPLESSACAVLDQERNALESTGVLADLHLKVDEAKALAKDRLQRVQRYVDIAGLILFRCANGAKSGDAPATATATASDTPNPPQPAAPVEGKRKIAPVKRTR